MTHSFTYKSKFHWGFIFLPIAGTGAIIYALLNPFTLEFKNVTLLEYPASQYVVLAICIIAIAYGIHKILKLRAINSNAEPIIATDQIITFNHLKMYRIVRVQLAYDSVTELHDEKDEDDGKSIVLYTTDKNRYAFFEDYFESITYFTQFKTILQQKCTSLKNKII